MTQASPSSFHQAKEIMNSYFNCEIILEKNSKNTTHLSLQACFVVAHSSGDLNKYILYYHLHIQSNLHNNNNNIIDP